MQALRARIRARAGMETAHETGHETLAAASSSGWSVGDIVGLVIAAILVLSLLGATAYVLHTEYQWSWPIAIFTAPGVLVLVIAAISIWALIS